MRDRISSCLLAIAIAVAVMGCETTPKLGTPTRDDGTTLPVPDYTNQPVIYHGV